MNTLAKARERVTKATATCELPLCFQLASIAAADLSLTRNTKSAKASRRRLVEKATKLASAEGGR